MILGKAHKNIPKILCILVTTLTKSPITLYLFKSISVGFHSN